MQKSKDGTKLCYAALALVAAVTVFFASMLPNIIMDNELRHFFPESHESYRKFNTLTEMFGDQYVMDIVIETNEDIILNRESLAVIGKITEDLEQLNNIVKIKSITNVDFITDDDGHLSTGQLIPEDFSGTAAEVQRLKQRILEWPKAYIGTLVSSDFKGVQIIATLNSDSTPPEVSTLYYETIDVVNKHLAAHASLNYKIAGDPVLGEYGKIFMYADLKNLIPLITVVVLLCLFLSFRNAEGTLLPLITVLISTIWTAGIMAMIGEPLTIVSSCLPVLLIAVGSAYGIHIINYYYQRLEKEPLITDKLRHQALIKETLKSARSPVLLAGITTIAGFISTITSPIRPLKSFALFSAVGVVIALSLAFVFIPSILMIKSVGLIQRQQKRMSLRAVKKNARLAALGVNKKGATLDRIYSYFNKREGRFVFGLLVIVGLSVVGIMNLNIESAFLEYFPKNSKVRNDVSSIDTKYVGTTGFSLVIQGQEKGDMCNPAILTEMEKLEDYLQANHPAIGSVVSFTEFVKRMNQVMHSSAAVQGTSVSQNTSADFSIGAVESEENGSSDFDSFFEDESETVQSTGGASGSVESFFDEEEAGGEQTRYAELGGSGNAVNAVFARYKNQPLNADETIALFTAAYASANKSDLTVTEFMDAVKKQLNYRGAAYFEIPADISKYPVSTQAKLKDIVTQYLLLYSGSLDALLDETLEPKTCRMQIIMRTHDTGKIKDVISDARRFAETHFPEGYTLEAAGLGEMEVAMTSMIISSQVSSLVLAVGIVFLILAVFYRSVIAGIIGAIPLGVSILLNFGIMSLTRINLDMVTSLVAAIAIGIGIDYTVHFMNNYHNERIASDNLTQVTLNTLRHSGKGIAVNAFSVGCGFLVMCFSNFVVLRFVGFLVATVMLTSSVASLTILPVVLNMFKPKFMAVNR